MAINPRSQTPAPKPPHRLTLDERSRMELTGVAEVVRFDDETVVLKTVCGTLILRGSGLKLLTLVPDGGRVAVEGSFNALSYEQARDARGFWRRLFA